MPDGSVAGYREMEASEYMKTALNAFAAFEAISKDVWTLGVAPHLEATDILPMLAVDKGWRVLMRDRDVWLNKLTVLVMQYPALENIDQGSYETAFDWYWRLRHAVGSSEALAQRHVRGELPFLRLHGTVVGTRFV